MKDKEKQKYQKHQNHSILALSTNHGAEPTKKVIEPEEMYSCQPVAHNQNRLYLFRLPIDTSISYVVSLLTTRFARTVIHAEED